MQESWVNGALIGHYEDLTGYTGVSVVIFPEGATGGCHVAGFASGTGELCSLSPFHVAPFVHGVCLTGGSAFGLDSARGVMDFLEEQGIGFPVGEVIVPLVPSVVIFDLLFGSSKARPGRSMGYNAAKLANFFEPAQGSIGCGTGATVGKALGMKRAMKSGVGISSRVIKGDAKVGVLAVVNAFGDIVDPGTKKVLAGLRNSEDSNLLSSTLCHMDEAMRMRFGPLTSTTLGVILTNTPLSKIEANKLAKQAEAAIFTTHSPAMTSFDGDVIFVFSTNKSRTNVYAEVLAVHIKEIFEEAVINAISLSEGFGLLPSCKDINSIS